MGKFRSVECLKVVLKKNFTLKFRSWASTLLELSLPVALMFLLIWIRVEIKTTREAPRSYIDSPENNPTWFGSSASSNQELLPEAIRKSIAPYCDSAEPSGLCPEIFAKATWLQRQKYRLGESLDGLLQLHMALYNQRLGIVGSEGKGLAEFIENLPGYTGYTLQWDSEDDFTSYISDTEYGFIESKPQLFGAIHVKEAAARGSDGTYSGQWDIVIQLNATGPGSLDFNGATDINSKLFPSTSPLQKDMRMSVTRVYWAGGLFHSKGLPVQTGGYVDLQALVYSWIYNSTGAFDMPTREELRANSRCLCEDDAGQPVDDFKQCKGGELNQLLLLSRLLTPRWSTAQLGDTQQGCLGRFSSLFPLSVREIPFPTPAYTKDTFARIVSGVFGLFFVLVYLWPLTRIMKCLVEDKENKINEVMKMMGMPSAIITQGWYITYASLWLLPCVLIVATCSTTVFEHSNKFLVWLFFWLFGLCVVTFCSFISVFFARAKTASVVGALLFFLLYFPYYFVKPSTVSMRAKTWTCILPPIALSFGASQIAELESGGVGAQWSTIHEEIDNLTFSRVLGMMAFDVVFYALLAWYFDKVLVVGFGTRQPWYFPFTKHFWCPGTSSLSEQEAHDLEQGFDDVSPDNPRYEPIAAQLAAQRSVLIRELSKEFKTADGKILKAVNNLTVNLYSSQIFCLLGHNGAGKTTTINMLSGMLPLSSGDAIMYGKSVRQDMASIRQDLGVCPQHDVIWAMLTVREHLQFFASLKGVSADAVALELHETIAAVGLQEKQHALAGTLSGGQKRRLSAAIALIGGSKVVFLDEPSSGVDPFSRRELWDCFKQKKEGRSVILTTHFMDEAEELGDRIAIMAAGQIKCVGSSLFLKSSYGVGYTLTIAKKAAAAVPGSLEMQALKGLVESTCPRAELLSDVGSELVYRMQMEYSKLFPELFERFEQSPDMYGVDFFSVSVTTLEEVFLRVGQDEREADVDGSYRQEQSNFVRQLSGEREEVSTAPPRASGGRSLGDAAQEMATPLTGDSAPASTSGPGVFFRHTHALLAKRYHNAKRDKKQWCCQVAMPLLFLLTALASMKFTGVGSYPVTTIGLTSLPSAQQLVYAAGPGVDAAQVHNFMQGIDIASEVPSSASEARSGIPLNATAFDEYLAANYYRSDSLARYGAFRFNYVPTWDQPTQTRSVQEGTDVWTVQGYKKIGQASAARAVGPLTAVQVPVGTLWRETVALPAGQSNVSVPLGALNNRLQVDMFWNSTARDAVPIFYQQLHLQLLQTALRAQGGRQQRREAGGAPSVKMGNKPFPLTSGQKNLQDSGTSLNLALGFAFIPASFGAFVVLERETGSKHLQIISGVNFISYWFATWLWDMINYLVPALLSVVLIAAFGVESLVSGANLFWTLLCVLFYGASCSSFTYMLSFLFKSHTSAQSMLLVVYLFTGGILEIVSIVLAVIPSTKDLQRHVLIYLFRLLPNFCLADALTNLITRTSVGLWSEYGCPLQGCEPSDLIICGYDLLYMGVGSVVWFVITLFLELALATPRLRAALRLRNIDVQDERAAAVALDADVEAEKQRVQRGDADQEMVVLKGLRKVFPGRHGLAPKVAVEDMHFGIPEGQCFGYLGMNGAGKTTTMKILTGEELCTSGEATLGGFDVMTQQNEVRRLIGYCPQFDALIGTLTAREHLTLFARIKGLPASSVRDYVDRMLDQLTLSQFADRQAHTFSGGTRRKLSLGIALVGNPRIVFLDEPTTGVDPESRRFMWKLISTTMQGRSVILTTHSMDECEALCGRIGIMVNGRLVCLGSASHLKATHGYGYRFDVTFKLSEDFKVAYQRLAAFVFDRFPAGRGGAKCIEGDMGTNAPADQFRQRVKFRLPKGRLPISAIFREVEEHRAALQIAEYSISETTLDQIFIQFARHQWDGEVSPNLQNGSFMVSPDSFEIRAGDSAAKSS